MAETTLKPGWNEALRGLLAMLPENLDRKMLLAHYADRMGIPRDDFKRRFPGYDTAMISFDDFEDVLAYFCQDLIADRVGSVGAMTQDGFDATVAEVLRALVDDALRHTTAGQAYALATIPSCLERGDEMRAEPEIARCETCRRANASAEGVQCS